MARILIVEDHPIVRQGMKLVLQADPSVMVCGEASGVTEARSTFRETQPDLVVVDLSLEDGSGLELVKELVATRPGTRILVHSAHDETMYAERALRAGAMGFVSKSSPPGTLREAARRVLAGHVYVSERMTDRLLGQNTLRVDATDSPSPLKGLSDRELEVLTLIGRGSTTKEIATHLDLSPKTIESHRENLKSKLALRNATELVQYAVRWALDEA